MKSALFLVGGGHQSRFFDFAPFIVDDERTSHFDSILKPYAHFAMSTVFWYFDLLQIQSELQTFSFVRLIFSSFSNKVAWY